MLDVSHRQLVETPSRLQALLNNWKEYISRERSFDDCKEVKRLLRDLLKECSHYVAVGSVRTPETFDHYFLILLLQSHLNNQRSTTVRP
jgi:hypothetical protein